MAVLEYVKTVSGNTWVYGAKRRPKYSTKAGALIKVNYPAPSNNQGPSASKEKDEKDYERVVSGAIVAWIPYKRNREQRRALVLI